MTNPPLPCPFCGLPARRLDRDEREPLFTCSKPEGGDCPAHMWAPLDVWNRRAERTSVAPPPIEKDITNLRHWYKWAVEREGHTHVDHDSMFRILSAIDPALSVAPELAPADDR